MSQQRLNVVIVGMGRVGTDIARELDGTQHRVTVIDKNPKAFDGMDDIDMSVLVGHGATPTLLKQAGVDTADLLIACTENDEVNLLASIVGKRLGAKQTIARVHNSDYEEMAITDSQETGVSYDLLGVDFVVNPRMLVAEEMIEIARSHGALDVHFFNDHQLELAEMKVHEASPVVNKPISAIDLPKDTLIGAVMRQENLYVPTGADRLESGDRIYLFGRTDRVNEAEDLVCCGNEATKVAIFGDMDLSEPLAMGLSHAGIETLLIVEDRDAAEYLAAKLPKTTVICGQGSDVDLFKQERLGLYDIYFAVTADDESNLISGLLAKSLGVERVACLVQRQDFGSIYPKVGIDVVLSSRQVAADKILSFTRANLVENIVHLSDGRAEVYELAAQAKSAVVKHAISDLKLPTGVFFGGVLRGDDLLIPNGQFQIAPLDRVVVLSLTEQRGAVEKLFRKQFF